MKLKVLEIIGDSSLAGAPRHLLALLENFDLKKFEVFVICPPGPLAGELRSLKRDINLEVVKMRSKFDTRAISEIRKNIKHVKPDIVHAHGVRGGCLGRLASIGLHFPVIYTEHLWTRNYKLSSRIANGIQVSALWFLDMFTDLNIAVSQAVKDFMVESQISRPSKIEVIYNGIEPTKKKANIFSGHSVKLGTVGTLNFQKGIQFLIEAMPKVIKEFGDVKLVIVGEGEYLSYLKKLVKRYKLTKSITFTGFSKNVEDEMENFDIYVQPSLSESFGLAIVQAMSLGIPIVATNSGGIPEVVTAGKSGILVEPGNPDALAEAILELLRDKALAQKMGHLAAEEVRIKFNLEDMVRQTEGIYEEIVQAGA